MTHDIRYLAPHRADAGLHPLSDRDRRVIRRLSERADAARRLAPLRAAEPRSAASPLADRIATRARSRAFVVGFGLFLAAWTVGNGLVLARQAADPHALVALNLLFGLVTAAAIVLSRRGPGPTEAPAGDHGGRVKPGAEPSIAELHRKVEHLTARIDALAVRPTEIQDTIQAPTRRLALRIV